MLQQSCDGHHHQRDRAIAADVVLDTFVERLVDDIAVDRIEHDDRIVGHAKRGRRIDPVAVPSTGTQLAVHASRPVAPLAGDDGVESGERFGIRRIFQRIAVPADRRTLTASARGREKYRLDQLEVAFFEHALHQHGSNHAPPSDKTYAHHLCFLPSGLRLYSCAAETNAGCSLAIM